jgi:hypothetical protein
MTDERKRLPWWLMASAVLLVLFAAVLGFVETVGRRGTIMGRIGRVHVGMSRPDVIHIMGAPDADSSSRAARWHEHTVGWEFQFDGSDRVTKRHIFLFTHGKPSNEVWWHLRLWSERVWMKIHGLAGKDPGWGRAHFVTSGREV